MTQQLDLDFAGYDQPNKFGVFVDAELIVMPRQKSNIRAELRIAFTAMGFCWGASAMLEQEGWGRMPNACDIPAGRVVTTRSEAINHACADMLRRVEKVETKGAKTVMAWVESIGSLTNKGTI